VKGRRRWRGRRKESEKRSERGRNRNRSRSRKRRKYTSSKMAILRMRVARKTKLESLSRRSLGGRVR
jgi:hypothetical protein